MSTIHRLFQKLLGRLASVIFNHPQEILVLSLLLTFLSGYVAYTRFKVVNNIAQLLDKDSPTNRNYLDLEKEFGTDEAYLVLIQSDDPDQNREVALKVGGVLKSLRPFVSRVWCKWDFSKLQDRFLLLASKEDLLKTEKEISENLQALQKTNVNLDLNSMLDEANKSFNDKYLRKKDSWKEFIPFIDRFKDVLNQLADTIEGKKKIRKAANAKMESSENLQGQDPNVLLQEKQFISFDEGRVLLVIGFRGAIEVDSPSPFTHTVATLRDRIGELQREYPKVKLGLTGEPVLDDDELQTSNQDTQKASVITGILIVCLFLVSYRNWWRPIFAGLSLGMAIAWTFAFTMLVIGHFNIISFAVIPMVLGLGIDFGIQIMGRYEEELGNGRPVHEALHTALSITGVAVLTGGSTTAAAFYTLCFNQFLGLQELGAIAGTSILFCLVGNLMTLPAIFVLWDRGRPSQALKKQATNSWGFMAPLDQKLVRYYRPALALCVLITALSIWGIFKVRFDYNLLHLQSQQLESVKVLHEMFNVTKNSTLVASVVAPDMEEARRLEKRLKALPTVSNVDSITSILPEDAEQEEKLPIVRRIISSLNNVTLDTSVADKVDVERARRDLDSFLQSSHEAVKEATKYRHFAQAKMAIQVFSGLIPVLERVQNAMKGLTTEELGRRLNQSQIKIFGNMKRNLAWLKTQKADRIITPLDLPQDLVSTFVSPSGKVLLRVSCKGDIWERVENHNFVQQLQRVAPNVTGTPVQNDEYIELLRTSFLDAAVWAFITIVVLLVFHFQTLKLVTLAVFPLVLAVIWRTGVMGWWDIPFNPANVVTLPLIIGIDVAFGVYVVDRFREDRAITLFSTSTGKAIVMTSLASLFGFVSLLVSRYQGMWDIGLLMTLGIGIGMITTILVLPQVLAWLGRKEKKK